MTKEEFAFIAVSDLRLGILVDLEVGWLKHPFPKSRFRITSPAQIETLRSLGLQRVRTVPALREAPPEAQPDARVTARTAAPGGPDTPAPDAGSSADPARAAVAQSHLVGQVVRQGGQGAAEQQFAEATQAYREVLQWVAGQPGRAAERSQQVVHGLLAGMLPHPELAIRLLQAPGADAAALHPVNVAVLSLLLGKLMGLPPERLAHLGLAAFLHDIGKQSLPERVRFDHADFSTAERALFQDHVVLGVQMAQSMGLGPEVQAAIAQHHVHADGGGYPQLGRGEEVGLPGRILAVVNQYDALCNPHRAGAALTPHEALALMFSRMKARFDGAALAAFIRMMGVYPPGSLVQLQDERYAMVVAVNAARPLKPRVMVHEAGVPRSAAVILDLETAPGAGIRRSLRPHVVPDQSLHYFAPPRHASYFFEPAAQPSRPFQSM